MEGGFDVELIQCFQQFGGRCHQMRQLRHGVRRTQAVQATAPPTNSGKSGVSPRAAAVAPTNNAQEAVAQTPAQVLVEVRGLYIKVMDVMDKQRSEALASAQKLLNMLLDDLDKLVRKKNKNRKKKSLFVCLFVFGL